VEFPVKTPELEARVEEAGGDVYAGGKPVPPRQEDAPT
jgi:hypothetical protein